MIEQFEIAWCGAYGVKDAGLTTAVRDTTQFQAASLSKPVFAYAVPLVSTTRRAALSQSAHLTSACSGQAPGAES